MSIVMFNYGLPVVSLPDAFRKSNKYLTYCGLRAKLIRKLNPFVKCLISDLYFLEQTVKIC